VAGKSEIKRIYTMTHEFELSGNYTISVRFKRQSKTVVSATTKVQVRPGAREGIGG
jgi:ferredoxin-NADP reductase